MQGRPLHMILERGANLFNGFYFEAVMITFVFFERAAIICEFLLFTVVPVLHVLHCKTIGSNFNPAFRVLPLVTLLASASSNLRLALQMR